MSKGQDLKRKIVFSLDSPNSTVKWPGINSVDQGAILDLLCSLLVPIGQHRRLYIQPSKGKRPQKRKRAPRVDTATPPSPELNLFLTIGLNSTTRHLESMVSPTLPPVENIPKPRLLAIFVCRSDSQPSQLHSHLPVLCHIASRSPPEHTIRLVQLPRGAEARLTTSLAIPQVGFLGLMEGAPGSTSLLRFLEEKVPAIEVPWLGNSLEYQPTIIKAMKGTAPLPSRKMIIRVDNIERIGK